MRTSTLASPIRRRLATRNLLERTIALPGGVTVTLRSAGNVWSYPNLHGDIVATATQTGTKIGTTATFDPNGNQTTGTTADNSTGNFDNRWLGQYQRPTETEPGLEPIIEMGARQYSPRLARFLETDPVTGGSANAYTYTFGDPNNTNDITGKCPECGLLALVSAYYANRSQDPLDYVRPLDHTWQMLAIFPHPPEPPRGKLDFGALLAVVPSAVQNALVGYGVGAITSAVACAAPGILTLGIAYGACVVAGAYAATAIGAVYGLTSGPNDQIEFQGPF